MNKQLICMAEAGYSGTPLLKKLGIKPDSRIRLIGAPANYFDLLGADLSTQVCTPRETPHLLHLFAGSVKEFEKGMSSIPALVKKNPDLVIWVSWHKKSSRIATDLTEDTIRNYALAHDLVDIKVCAVSAEWSGLKLVVPLARR